MIGPSKCDERRVNRERELREVWSELELQNVKPEGFSLLNPALDLFRVACSCYQNGAWMASTVMCGIALESGVYLVVSRKPTRNLWSELTVDPGLVNRRIGEMLTSAKADGLIDEETERLVLSVKEKRNFVAHYAQRFDEELTKLTRNPQNTEAIKDWQTKEDSMATLHQTAEVLRKLCLIPRG